MLMTVTARHLSLWKGSRLGNILWLCKPTPQKPHCPCKVALGAVSIFICRRWLVINLKVLFNITLQYEHVFMALRRYVHGQLNPKINVDNKSVSSTLVGWCRVLSGCCLPTTMGLNNNNLMNVLRILVRFNYYFKIFRINILFSSNVMLHMRHFWLNLRVLSSIMFDDILCI